MGKKKRLQMAREPADGNPSDCPEAQEERARLLAEARAFVAAARGRDPHSTSPAITNPFFVVPRIREEELAEEEEEKPPVDAAAANAEVDSLLTSPAGVKVVVDTGSKWDGVEKIASLEACNGVTKSRGVIFAPVRASRIHSFSFFLQLKRGALIGASPIVAVWDEALSRATDILYSGPPLMCSSTDEFVEMTCQLPADLEIHASRARPLVLAFWSENVTETRSAGADLAQVLGLVATAIIPKSVYLNGKMATGTWRTYDSTLVGRFYFTPTEPP